MELQIVIARFNEDISYLNNFKNIIIVYNKGNNNISSEFNSIKLPNIGRESHTYLYHIIQNYDNLANKTLFIQGFINDHKVFPIIDYFKDSDFTGNISEHGIGLIKNKIYHSGKYLNDLNNGNLIKSKYTPFEWMKVIGLNMKDDILFKMIWGSNFSVSKKKILEKPKLFYENLLKYVDYHNNPEEGHFFERSWYSIFHYTKWLSDKKIILYHDYKDKSVNSRFIINKLEQILIEDNNISEIHLWSKSIDNENIVLNYIFSENYIKSNLNSNNIKININYLHDFYIKIEMSDILNTEIYIEYQFIRNKIQLFINQILLQEYTYDDFYTNTKYDINIHYENNFIILELNNILLMKNYITFSEISLIKNIYFKSHNGVFIKTDFISTSKIYGFHSKLNKIFYKEYYEDFHIMELNEYLYQ
jgi:hypothetical protein